MTWRIERPSAAEGAEPHSRALGEVLIAGVDQSDPRPSPTYPDHWWGPDFWADLRASGRYAGLIRGITLPDPPGEEEARAELEELLRMQASPERRERIPEIVEEATAPPAYYRRMLFADPIRNVRTAALIGVAVDWSRLFVMAFKHRYKRPRPTQLEPRLRPVVDCPPHPAYPSGHSTQSHFLALVLGEATGREDIRDALWAASDRIAENREYAGLHYRSDAACGVELATAILPAFLAEHASAVAQARAEWSG
jgi:hypothetical protein